jgi:hypothetical protein
VAIYGGNGGETYGPQYLNAISCSTSSSGNTRTTEITVSFNTVFQAPATNNTISAFTEDAGQIYDNWKPFGTFNLSSGPQSLIGSYDWVGTCTVDCGAPRHTLKITTETAGTFSGFGFSKDDPRAIWTITGTENWTQKTITYHMTYTGINSGYTVDGTGNIRDDGKLEGAITHTSQGQTGTFVATPSTSQCMFKPVGDSDCNDKVNNLDYEQWKIVVLASITAVPSSAEATRKVDFNGDSKLDTDDFNIWRAGNFDSALQH